MGKDKKETEEQLEFVDKLGKILLSSGDIKEISRLFARELAELMSIDWAAIAEINQDKNSVCLSPFSPEIDSDWELGRRFTLAESPIAWVAKNKKLMLDPNLGRTTKFWTDAFWRDKGLETLIFLPLFSAGEVFGCLILGSKKRDAYRERELRLLRFATSQLAQPVRNSQLVQQNRFHKNMSSLLDEFSRALISSHLEEILPSFSQKLRDFIHFDRLALAHIDGSNLKILGLVSENGEHPRTGETYPIKDSAIPEMVKSREVNIARDFARECKFPVDSLHLREGLRGEIRVPFFSGERLFATLHSSSSKPYELEEWDISFLKQLGEQLAVPIEGYISRSYERGQIRWFGALDRELKNSLSLVGGSAKLLAEESKKDGKGQVTKLSKSVLEGTQKLEGYVNLLSTLREIESPDFSLNKETVEPKPIIRQVAEDKQSTEDKPLSFFMEIPDTLPQVLADGARLEEIVRILLDNAFNSAPEKGKTWLRTSLVEDELIIEVADSGDGFSPEEKEMLLRPYEQVRANRQVYPQLVLNLAVVRRLVELHGGRFWLDSEPKKGSNFGFSLPLATKKEG